MTTNPTEHAGQIIVDAGRMTQAHISAITMARAVTVLPKRKNIIFALPYSGSTNMSPVKKFNFTKRAPGSMICAHTNDNTTQIPQMLSPWQMKRKTNQIQMNEWKGWPQLGSLSDLLSREDLFRRSRVAWLIFV